MRRLLVLSLIALLIPAVHAQEPEPPSQEEATSALYEFLIEPSLQGAIDVPPGGRTTVELTVSDLSRDSTSGASGGQPGVPNAYGRNHVTSFDVQVLQGDPQGWIFGTIPPVASKGGQVRVTPFDVQASLRVVDHTVVVLVTATSSTDGPDIVQNFTFQFVTEGLKGFSARVGDTLTQLSPGETGQMSLVITNPALVAQIVHIELVDNPCNLKVGTPPSVTLGPKEANVKVPFTVGGPEEEPLYLSENCGLEFFVFPDVDPDAGKPVRVSVVVNGPYLDPVYGFYAMAAIAALIILLIFLARRKAAVEEELLGKPQRPWTIPVERVYLEHLEQRDPRAAYVVRHFLMEEEYQSALLWYKSFKGATKGTRAKERVVVAAENKYKRFQKKAEAKIAKPIKKADRLEAKLQKKLDRQAKKMVRKERRGWRKASAKLEKAVEARNAKTTAKWEKAAAKAEKKGQPMPPKPQLETPDIPPEPQLQKIHLENHKWNKKAERFRRKMIKKQGNLEVKWEKKESRILRKVHRKVQRIARKIDDPEFVAEHPILQKAQEHA